MLTIVLAIYKTRKHYLFWAHVWRGFENYSMYDEIVNVFLHIKNE